MTIRALTSLTTLVLVAATAHAAPPSPFTKVPLHAFPPGAPPIHLFALPNMGGEAILANDGTLQFRGAKLVLDDQQKNPVVRRYAVIEEGNRAIFVLEYKNLDVDDKQRTEKSIYNVKGKTELDIAGTMAVAAVDLAKGEVMWRTQAPNWKREPTWELMQSADTLLFRTLDKAYAIAKPSGRYRWVWDEDAHGGGLNDRYLLSWKFVDKSILFETTTRVDFEMYPDRPHGQYELDAATGLRVHRVTKVPKVEVYPIYTWRFQQVEYPGDHPAPAQPTEFDGLWLERTALLWNKRTLEGVVINPELAILPQIVAAAQKQTVDGKKIAWKYVIDIEDAAKTFPPARMRYSVMQGYKDPVAPNDEILFWPLVEFHFSGEKIVADELAKVLGAATLPKPTPEKTTLSAAPLFVFRDNTVHPRASIAENDVGRHIKVKWGPYVFYQRVSDWDHGWYKMEPSP